MVTFGDRKEIERRYKSWLKRHPEIKDCAFNVISFMSICDLVKDRTETDFYSRNENAV